MALNDILHETIKPESETLTIRRYAEIRYEKTKTMIMRMHAIVFLTMSTIVCLFCSKILGLEELGLTVFVSLVIQKMTVQTKISQETDWFFFYLTFMLRTLLSL
jgi:hypothetical protein